jgi:hypothetical protein
MYEKLPQRIEGLWKNLSDVLNAFGAIGDRLDPAKINSYADTLAIKTKE